MGGNAPLEEPTVTNEIEDRVAEAWRGHSIWLSLLRTGLNQGRFACLLRVLAERGAEPRGARALPVGCGGGSSASSA